MDAVAAGEGGVHALAGGVDHHLVAGQYARDAQGRGGRAIDIAGIEGGELQRLGPDGHRDLGGPGQLIILGEGAGEPRHIDLAGRHHRGVGRQQIGVGVRAAGHRRRIPV